MSIPRELARVPLVFAALLLMLVGSLAAQEEDPSLSDSAEEQNIGADPEDMAQIDQLLKLDEEILADPGTYSYDPAGRRDPFRSLIKAGTDDRDLSDRPDGIPGLLIDEIEVEGVFVLGGGPVAQIRSSSQETSYLLRPGDQLWDGEVVDITMDDITFKQSVNDPTALKPFREVVKQFNP